MATVAACDDDAPQLNDAAVGIDGGAIDASADAGPSDYQPWALVVLPDTQQYAYTYPEIFTAQTSWIADNAASRNIRFVLHVGDITEWSGANEWTVAKNAFAPLQGLVPFALLPGNHDYAANGERVSPITQYFPVADFEASQSAGGLYEPNKLDNAYHLFSVNNEDWLVLALEWGPRQAVIDWANGVLDAYPERSVIIITHAYLYIDSTRYDWAAKGTAQSWNPHSYVGPRWPEVNDGEELWQKLIKGRSNVRFVICGHAAKAGIGRLTSQTDTGATVHQLLANFQDYTSGGAGYLRLMEFYEDHVDVTTYSPWLDAYYEGPENKFTLPR